MNKTAFGLFFRSFLIQSFWNREGLQNVGFAYMIMPYLKEIYKDNRARFIVALRRHTEYFVTNPYMATMVSALVLDRERKAYEDPAVDVKEISLFKRYLSSSTAAMGDSLIWGYLRPMASLIGCAFFYVTYDHTDIKLVSWILIMYLSLYNIITLNIRYWLGALALKHKMHIVLLLKRIPMGSLKKILSLSGFAVSIVLAAYFILAHIQGQKPRIMDITFFAGFLGLKLLHVNTVVIFIGGLLVTMFLAAMGYI